MTRTGGLKGIETRDNGRSSASAVVGVYSVLTIIGFVALWSGSSGYALRQGKSANYFAVRQILFILLSAGTFVVTAIVPIERLRKLISPLTFVSLFLLVLPFVPGIGVEINGARRWIDLKFTYFQPSELWKPLSIAYVAHRLDKKDDVVSKSPAEAIFPFLVVAAGAVIIYLQDDFSTSMVALASSLGVFWLAGTSWLFFAGIIAVAIPTVFIMIASSEYRLTRILGFIIPDYDPHGMNYQVQNSIRAIITGGLWGEGLGLGTRKLASIPEVQSDFIFAAFAEETGFLGVVVVFACWIFLAVKVFQGTKNRLGFGYTLPMGLLGLLLVQVLLNLGVVSGFLPATGIALPFFSAGGSSAVATGLSFGLIVNVLRNPGFEPVGGTETRSYAGGYAHG